MDPLLYLWLFLKASLLSTGGLGNLPFLHKDLIPLGWAQESDFLTAIAVGQISPGPSGLWSIALGYLTYGWLGAGMALAAVSLPPLLVLVVAGFYNRLQSLSTAQDFIRGLAIGVVGMMAAVTLSLVSSSISDWRGVLIMLAALAMALSKRVPIIVILALAAVAGLVIY